MAEKDPAGKYVMAGDAWDGLANHHGSSLSEMETRQYHQQIKYQRHMQVLTLT